MLTRMTKLKKIDNINTGKDVGQWTLYICVGEKILVQPFQKIVWHNLPKLKVFMSYGSSIPPRYTCNNVKKNIKEILFIIGKIEKAQ